MIKTKEYVKHLKAFDLVVVVFYLILTLLHIIFYQRIDNWWMWIIVNAGIIFTAFALAYFETNFENKFWRTLHYWYVVPLILITFKQIYFMVKPIRVYDFDNLFIADVSSHTIRKVAPISAFHDTFNISDLIFTDNNGLAYLIGHFSYNFGFGNSIPNP